MSAPRQCHPRQLLAAIVLTALPMPLLGAGCGPRGSGGWPGGMQASSPRDQLVQSAAAESQGADAAVDVPIPPGVDPGALARVDRARSLLEFDAAIDAIMGAAAPLEFPPIQPVQISPDARRAAVAHYVRGRMAIQDGRSLLGISELRRSLEIDPTGQPILRELARAYLATGDVSRAAGAYQRLLQLDPDDQEARLSLGVAAADGQQHELAVQLLAPLWADPSALIMRDVAARAVAGHALATSLRQLGYDLASVDSRLHALEVSPTMAIQSSFGQRLGVLYQTRGDRYTQAGDVYCRLGEYEAALAAYEQARELPRSDPAAIEPRMIYANLRIGRTSAAQLLLLDVLGQDDIGSREVRLCNYVASYGGDTGALAEEARAIYAARPTDATVVRAVAAIVPPDEARAMLLELVRRQPRNTAVVTELLAWLGKRDPALALDLTEGLVNDHPDLAAVYVQRLAVAVPEPMDLISLMHAREATPVRTNIEARLLTGFSAVGLAWDCVQSGLERWPEDPTLLVLSIDVAAMLAEPRLVDEAVAGARTVDESWAWVIRSLAMRALDRPDAALDAAREALRRDPESLEALVAVAEAEYAVAAGAGSEEEGVRLALVAAESGQRAADTHPGADEAYRVLVELYRRGGLLADSGRLQATLRQLLASNSDSRYYALLSAQEAAAQGRVEAALDQALSLYDADPADGEALGLALAAWNQLQRLEDAAAWLDARRAERPGDPVLLEQWTRVAIERGEMRAAIEALQAEVNRHTANEMALIRLETVLRESGDVEGAVRLGRNRLLARPRGVHRELGLAAMEIQVGDYDSAVDRLGWIGERPEIGGLTHIIPALTLLAGLGDEASADRDRVMLLLATAAIEHFEEAPLQIYGAALLALARMDATEDGRFDDTVRAAIENAPGADDGGPRGALSWRRTAQILVQAGQPAAAARALRGRLYSMAPLDIQARSLLTVATLAIDAGTGGAVESTFELLIDLDDRNALPVLGESAVGMTLAEAFYEASNMYSTVGDDAGAARLLQECIRLDDTNAMARNNLGYMRIDGADAEYDPQVEAWVIEAIELAPEDPNVLDTLGWLRYRQERLADEEGVEGFAGRGAETLIREAIERDTDPSGEVLDHLGDTLFRMGDVEGAQYAWANAARRLSDPSQAEQIRQNLLLLQTRVWGIVIADPDELYQRGYGQRLDRVRDKLAALDRGEIPEVAPLFTTVGSGSASD